jgi:serine protease Do
VVRGALGLAPDDLKPYRAAELKLDGGAIVTNVPNDGPAAKAGLKKDDIILRIGNMQVKSQMDVRLAMYKYPPGSTVEVEVLRDGQRKTFKVVAATPEDIEKVIPTTPRVEDNDEQNPFKRFEEFFNRPRPQNEGNKTPDDEVRPLRSGPAKLGVDLSDLNDDVRKQYSIPNSVKGAVVMAVTPGSVGEMLGLEPGMVITKFGNKDINSAMDLKNAISGYKWGDKATIQFGQYGKGMQIQQTRDFKFQ